MVKRSFFKWNINELLSLQREFDLLELSIQDIAKLHQRSERSILCRLEKEGLIQSWENAKGYDVYVKKNPELFLL